MYPIIKDLVRMEITGLMKAVKATITKHSMLKPGDAVLAGISGGADSIALLHILLKLSPELDLRLGIAHFNHGLRAAESDRDAEFVVSFAKNLNLPCYSKKVDVKKFSIHHKLSTEEAGRILRHKFLSETAREHDFDKIALGHQKDDMAETVLINILRGSGPQGISGIPPKREMVIRPLIDISRSDIEYFLQSENIVHITDSSNMDPRFLRNRIRHHLIPLLASEYNSEVVENLNRTAEIIRDEQTWLDSVIDLLFQEIQLPGTDSNIRLPIPELKKMPVAATRRIIRKAVFKIKGNLHGVGFRHMDAILELITSQNKTFQLDFPGPVRIKCDNDILEIVRRKNKGRIKNHTRQNGIQQPLFEYVITSPQTVFIRETNQLIQLTELSSPEVSWLKKSNSYAADPKEAVMDMVSLCYPLLIRSFRPGDRFRPLGLSGFQKLKKFFINNKVPFSHRKNIPIMECSGKIIWIAGYQIDDSVKIKSSTQKVLKARLLTRSEL
jgi:tRNA(Ile)-lysidine synthase